MNLKKWRKKVKKSEFIPILVKKVKYVRSKIKNKKQYQYWAGNTTIAFSKTAGPFICAEISKKDNKTVKDWIQTILHEMLHGLFFLISAWFNLKYTAHSEEKFIIEMEDDLLMNWHLLRKKKRERNER